MVFSSAWLLLAVTGVTAATNDFYVLITFSSNWGQYCAVASSFKSSLASYVSTQTKQRLLESEINIASTTESCSNQAIQNSAAEIRVTVLNEAPNNGSVSESRTKLLVDALKGSPTVGGVKVSKVEFREVVSQKFFTTKNILIVILILCLVYLVGFVCILGTMSDRDKEATEPTRVILLPKLNPGFDSERSTSLQEKATKLKGELEVVN